MIRPPSAFPFLLLIVCVLLAAGCIQQTAQIEPVSTPTTPLSLPALPVTEVSAVTTAAISCSFQPNETEWIRLDPFNRVEKGDPVRITGATNIPAGKTLYIAMYESSFHPHCKCCFDDNFGTIVAVSNSESGCANTFSLLLDTTNIRPQEFLVSVTSTDNTSVETIALFTLSSNTTPLVLPDEEEHVIIPAATEFAMLRPDDVKKGDIQTIHGILNGSTHAIIYSVREAGVHRDCSPLSPMCKGSRIFGTVYPERFGPDGSLFAIRFATDDLEPGKYIVDLDLTCTDYLVRGWFNVTAGEEVSP